VLGAGRATGTVARAATPDELDDRGIAPCGYDDLEAVRFTRGFLASPDRFTRAALDDD
jgi:predicted ATPase